MEHITNGEWSELLEISSLLKSQDNQLTAWPVFTVSAKYGKSAEFAAACFTQRGADDYLSANGHNLNKPFVYVESGHRNTEWQLIRKLLLNLPALATPRPTGTEAASEVPTEEEFVALAIETGKKEGWAFDAENLLSEGSLAVACVKAGYEMAAALSATQHPTTAAAVLTDAEYASIDHAYEVMYGEGEYASAAAIKKLVSLVGAPTTAAAGGTAWVPASEYETAGHSNLTVLVPDTRKPGQWKVYTADYDGKRWENSERFEVLDVRYVLKEEEIEWPELPAAPTQEGEPTP